MKKSAFALAALTSLILAASTAFAADDKAKAPAATPATPATPATAAAPAAKPAEAPKALSGQQNRMKTCNVDAKAKGIKGKERKDFMKSCLSGDAAAPTPAATTAAAPAADGNTDQQNKMKTCNADAKTKALKGKERKEFMSTCLKG